MPTLTISQANSLPLSWRLSVSQRDALLVAILGAALTLAYLLLTPLGWLAEEPKIAAHLASGHGYLSAMSDGPDSVPTAISPPLYPLLMAGIYLLFGVASRLSIQIMLALNVIAVGAMASAVYLLARRCLTLPAARYSAALFLMYPLAPRVAAACWDTTLAMALFLWIVVWALKLGDSQRAPFRKMISLGAALGILALLRPNFVLAYPFLVGIAIGRQRLLLWLTLATVCFTAFLVVLTPWTVRNYHVLGRLMFVRDNYPLEIWMGNQPGSYGHMDHDSHPSSDAVEQRRYLAMGELAYFDECWSKFRSQYDQSPATFWYHTFNRAVILVCDNYPDKPHRMARIMIDGLLAILGIAGVWIAWRLKFNCHFLFLIGLLSVLPYVGSMVFAEYAMPLRLMFTIYGGLTLASLVSYFSRRKWPHPIPVTV